MSRFASFSRHARHRAHRSPAGRLLAASAVAALCLAQPLWSGPSPLSNDDGRKRGSMDGAGGGNVLVTGTGTAKVQPLVPVAMVEAFALDKAGVEACEPIEGVVSPAGVESGCLSLPGGIAHVAAGCGARNAGFCTINLRGVEPDSLLVLARLYVMVISDTDPPQQQISLTFQSHAVRADLVGHAEPPCWTGTTNGRSALYAADVGHLIPSVINHDYAVRGLPSNLTHGVSPFLDHPDDPPLAQGAALVVAFSNERVPDDSVVYVHEDRFGLPVLATGLNVSQSLSLPTPLASAIRFTSIGADGQAMDESPLLPIDTYFTGAENPVQIRGIASTFDPRPDWTGGEGGSMPQLFDVRTTELPGDPDLLPAGSLQYDITYQADPPGTGCSQPPKGESTFAYDCVNVGVHVLTVCGTLGETPD